MADCEYERMRETRGQDFTTTDGTRKITFSRSYSCLVKSCPHPDRKCKVKEGS